MSAGAPRTPRGVRGHKQSGIALLVILLIVLTFGVGILLQRANEGGLSTWGRREASADALQRAKEALIAYALTYRDRDPDQAFGFFPCPDTDGNGVAEPNCNVASRGAIGLLPYKTLGLPDLRDAEGNCLWYAVSGAYKENPKGLATPAILPTGWAPLPLNWDTQGQFRVLDADGNVVAAPDDANGGAAVVIFAPNGPTPGQTRTTTTTQCGANPAQMGAYLDEAYRNDPSIVLESAAPNLNFATGQTVANQPITVRQGVRRDAGGNITNNDVLTWISPRELFDRIVGRNDVPDSTVPAKTGLFNGILSDIGVVLESRIQTDIDNGVGATASRPDDLAGAYASSSTHWVGRVPAAYGPDPLMPIQHRAMLANWSENIHLATCKALSGTGPGCLTMGGKTCRGGVFFSGRRADGQPRTAAQHLTSTPTLSAGYEPSAAPSPGALELLDTVTYSSTVFPAAGKSRYSDDPALDAATRASRRAADTGMCVMPDDVTFISLRATPGAFVPGIARTSESRPEATVDVGNRTIVLGNTAGSDPGAGCVWFPQAVAFRSSLRAYFRVQVIEDGEGMTFAIADAAPSINLAPNTVGRSQIMCGGPGAALGYSGAPVGSTVMGISPPKLAIEIDTDDSGGSSGDSSSDHLAVQFWGGAGDNLPALGGGDDNQHGAGTNGLFEPRNPPERLLRNVIGGSWSGGVATLDTGSDHGFLTGDSAEVDVANDKYNGVFNVTKLGDRRFSFPLAIDPGGAPGGGTVAVSGFRTVSTPYFSSGGSFPRYSGSSVPHNGVTKVPGVIHVRVEIDRVNSITLPQSSFSIRVYSGDLAGFCGVEEYLNLATNVSALCPLHEPQLVLTNVAIGNTGAGRAFDTVYLGFTNGQGNSGSERQHIVVSNFRARIQ